MPQYQINVPGKGTFRVNSPTDLTDVQVWEAVQGQLASAPAPAPAPSTERTVGEAFKDIGASVVGGFGSLLQVPGQLAQLVPGLQGVGQAIAKPGEALEDVGERLKSEGLKVREALRSKAISEAEKDGILSSFATAITETVKDPALLSTFITGQLPQLLGPAAAAKVGKAVVLSRSGLEGAELAAQAGKIGTRSAVGAGAAMQGADISADAYKQALEAAQKQGMSEEDANAAALLAARKAFALATPISVLSQALPGGSAIERRLAGVAGKGRLKSAIGEAVSEAAEEGGGAFATNVGVLGVDPTRELTQGVGAAAGLGTIGGGILGGVLGKAPAPELPPELRPGETDRQAAERIQAEILAMKEAAKPPAPGPILDTNNLYTLMAQPNGYALVEQYKQRLAELPETEETKAAIEEASFIQRRSIIEGLERQPTKAVLNDKILKKMGFKPKDGVYESLLGMDMASPDQADEITQTLSAVKAQEDITPAFVGKIDNAINVVNDLQQRIYPKAPPGAQADVGEAVTPPSGEGVPLAVQPSAGAAPTGLGVTEPSGVVPAVADVGQPAGRAEAQPLAVTAPIAPSVAEVATQPVVDQKTVETPKAEELPIPLTLRLQSLTNEEKSLFNFNEALQRAKQPITGFDWDAVTDSPSPDGRGMTPEKLIFSLNGAVEALKVTDGKLRSQNRTGATPQQLIEQWTTASQIQSRIDQSKQESPELWSNYDQRQKEIQSLKVGDEVQLPDGEVGKLDAKFAKNWRVVFPNPTESRLGGEKTLLPSSVLRPVEVPAPTISADIPAAEIVTVPTTTKGAVEQHAVKGLPIIEAPIEQLSISKDVPQFKSEADVSGIVKPLEGKFERTGVAPIQLWRRTDGRLEVISGRHRFDLAKRSGETTIPAQIHDEAAGFDAAKAATLDAELNIRDEQGEVKDYVTYFERSGISEADAKARGLLGRTVGQRGWTIASQGSPDLIAAHRAGIVPDDAAAGIAAVAPGDARLQSVGIKAVRDNKSAQAAVNTVQAVKALAAEKGAPEEEAGDLFGFDDSAIKEAEEMARIATEKQRAISSRLAAITGAANKPAVAKAEGIDIKDEVALNKRVQELRQVRAAWNNWSSNPDLIKEIRDEMTKPVEPKKSLVEMRKRYEAGRAALAPVETKPEPTELDKEIEAKIEELGRVLSRIMGRFGLKDVALNLVEDMKAEGEYAQSVIRLALDAASPVQALRHESIHALKELGFFTPQQWAALEKQAKSKWIDQYLKNVNINKEPLGDGEKSRYDAYMDLYKGDMDAIIEEAIADAFGDFDVNKAPPGLMQAILTRLRNFFDAVKTAFGGEITAEQVFRKVEKGELKAEAAPATKEEAKPSLRAPEKRGTWYVDATPQQQETLDRWEDDRTSGTPSNWQDLDIRPAREDIYDSASGFFYDYEKAKGLFEIPIADIGPLTGYDNAKDKARIQNLAEQIKENREIEPVFVAVDPNGEAYLMEGQHRSRALELLGYKSVPARVIVSMDHEEQPAAKPSLRAPQTEAFKKWFGNSKVVDENGDPLVVYHGTLGDFSVFDSSRAAKSSGHRTAKWGFFFSASPQVAEIFAGKSSALVAKPEWSLTSPEGLDKLRAVFGLKPKNVRRVMTREAQFESRFASNANLIPGYLSIANPREISAEDFLVRFVKGSENAEEFVKRAKQDGHDGIVIRAGSNYDYEWQGSEYAADAWVAFEPTQIKSATGNIGTFDSTKPDIRYSLRQVPLSTRGLMEVQPIVAMQELGLKTDAVRKPGGIELFNDVRSIALALNQDTIRNRGQIAKTDTSLTSEKELARAMVDEIGYQLRATADTGTGKGWYSDNYPKAVKKLGKLFPELETDPYARTVFSALVAITSNGEKVSLNVKNAIKLYEDIRMGKDPRGIGSRRQKALDNNLAVVLQLMKQYGPTGMRNELLREITVKDMNAILRSRGEKPDTSYLADTKVPAAALYFGPKLGAFFSNLEGAEGYLTMDMWWTRTVNRMRGQLESKATEASIKKFANMMDKPNATREEVIAATIPLRNKYEEFGWHTELEELVGKKEPAEDKDKPAWTAKAKRKAGPAYEALLFEHRLEKMANTIYKNEYELLEEAPFTSTDREFMYRTARRAQSLLKAEGINLSLADIQAALWYYEKRLYQHLSGRKADDIGYDEAITQLARESTGPARPSVVFGGQSVSGAGPAGAGAATTGVGGKPAKLSLRSTIPTATRQRIVQTTIARDEKTFYQRIIEAISPNNFQSFRADALNRYDQLSVYDKKLAQKMGGKALLASSSAESAALFSDLGAGLTASALGVHDRMGGVPVYRNGVTVISNQNGTVKGPTAIFAPLAKQPGDYQAYQYWAAVKRGLRFIYTIDPKTGQPIEKLITAADGPIAEALRKQYLRDFKIDFDAIQKEWIKYNDGLVDYMLATGVLSQDRADIYKQYADYLPFYRQMDGVETVGPKIFQSISGIKPPKKLKGGEAPIDDFLENIVRNTQSAIQAGIKNIAAQRAAEVATKIDMAERLKYHSTAPNVFHVYENGKPVSYETQDQLFINAIKSLGLPDLPFIGLFSGPANLLRNLVTKDPGFMLANLMRDSMSAWVTSGVKMTPMVDTITNFGAAIAGKSPEFQALMNSGILGGYEFSQNVEQSGREFGKALRKQANVKQPGMKGVLEMGAKPFTSLWEALEKGSTASDAATRMEVYKKTLAETGNEAEALHRALEVMNFNRKGSSAVIRVLTAAVPFLNARMQGLDVLYRAGIGPALKSLKGEPLTDQQKAVMKSFFVRGATLAALSTFYWAMTHDDDEYKKQEQETRDNYWLLPSLGVKIPIPFEIGVLFKVIPERILGYAFGSDTGEDFLKSMARQLTSTLAFNPIPQTVLPVVESMTNFSFFTMRPIVGQGLEGLQPAYQVGPGTSRIAEKIGAATKSLPTELQISPAKLDQMISGYTGTMGMYMVNLMDAVFDMNTDSPKPARRFEQMPLIRRFAIDPEARGSVTAYYELKNSVDSIVRTSNMLERTMNYEELPAYLQDNAKMLATKDYLLDLEKTMKEFREMKILIRSAKMSAEAKGDAIASIEKMENQLTANIQYLKSLAKGG